MKRNKPLYLLLALACLCRLSGMAQTYNMINDPILGDDSVYVRGYVEDRYTGRHLLDVNVAVEDIGGQTVTRSVTCDHSKNYGQFDIVSFAKDFYALKLPAAGHYSLVFSVVGNKIYNFVIN